MPQSQINMHYLLVIDMQPACDRHALPTCDRHELEFEVFTIPLMDDKISARGYTSTVQDGFPLQYLIDLVFQS